MTLLEAHNKLALNACETVRGIVVFQHKNGLIVDVPFKVEPINFIPPKYVFYALTYGNTGARTLFMQQTYYYN